MSLDAATVSRWIDEYLEAFAACTRGDRDMSVLLSRYGVPLIITTDDGVITLMTDDEAAAVMQSLVDGLRANGYDHTDVLHSEVSVLNSVSALYRGTLSRRNRDGGEIDCPTITYLLADDVAGLRIVLLATHGQ
jgi:hypothetical protein